MMLLLEVDAFRRRITALGKDIGPKLVAAIAESADKFRKYMLVRTLLSLVTGLAVWGFAELMGVQPAFAWGLLAFALNYIPFVGSFVATILPGVFALAQLDSWQTITLVIIGLACIQFVLGNYVEPLVAGAALSISPFAVVFAVFFWDSSGHTRRLYRCAHPDRAHDHLREIPREPLGLGPLLGRAAGARRRRREAEPHLLD